MTTSLKDDLASLRIDHSARGGGNRRGAWIVLAILIVAATAGGYYAWSREPVVEVKTATVAAAGTTAGAAGSVLNASGYVTARRRATVSSKVTGKVLDVFVEEGRAVRKGDVLARLDDTQMRAILEVSEARLAASQKAAAEDQARLREAELTLERRRQLVKEQVISRAELDAAEAQTDSLKARIALAQQQVAVAQSEVNARRTDLGDMVVRAPFDGVAISKDAQPGEMISPVSAGGGFTRTGICTIVDMSSLEIEVDVSEQYINRVRPGQPVEAVLDAYPDWRIPAHVITTVPSADRQRSTVRVRIGFDAAKEPVQSRGNVSTPKLDPRILPDMGVKTTFLAERRDDAQAPRPRLLVPKTAVRSSNGATVVFVVRGERVERRAVKAGAEDGGQIEVASGLSPGERLVVDGPATLTDGTRIKER